MPSQTPGCKHEQVDLQREEDGEGEGRRGEMRGNEERENEERGGEGDGEGHCTLQCTMTRQACALEWPWSPVLH